MRRRYFSPEETSERRAHPRLASEPQNLVMVYVVQLLRANGQHNPKVFKLRKVTLGPGEVIAIAKNHSFEPVATRRYYPGPHMMEPQVNGTVFGRVEFELRDGEG